MCIRDRDVGARGKVGLGHDRSPGGSAGPPAVLHRQVLPGVAVGAPLQEVGAGAGVLPPGDVAGGVSMHGR
eukprot:10034649-Alexandrium_andersonii.AAC.1